MPKLKTHSGTKKRVRVTKTGKILHRHTRLNHFLEKKSASRKRRLAQVETLKGAAVRNVRRKLGV
ncbi:TPA: 50S ribosomal protein L35 [Candidatus Saccharibacteria bacterium]|nr:MAG: 50S ribosomal protein L35 [Candidatus Saccharibacteria bacterium RIFCSPLOWO2_02_FULL_46_7]HCM51795.1 50S ribosomal protein L35 [Candidatus Saccharibacteria bacterium]